MLQIFMLSLDFGFSFTLIVYHLLNEVFFFPPPPFRLNRLLLFIVASAIFSF